MSYKDVREWIQKVDEMGELKIVENADWNLEIGALSVLSSKHKENTPALLFDASKITRRATESSSASSRASAVPLIDACRPFEWMANFPPAAEIDAEYQKSLMEKWRKELFS